ncbi:G2/mitotic-specific cyclin-A-like isoform X2 [Anneissia japonica]|uniref:G2/mitotic-specific cyclin-A-like isoform X2 n=1 Tax=Anneissia japonica TaxID=1529436 RepID=UPI001425849F|nr:G2/mitotic-specific cyclin-A-like isoform X2 [Anneissia japonica]
MAQHFGGTTVFMDVENRHTSNNQINRKSKREDASNRGQNGPQATKRAALVAISTNTSTRIQPFRAVKQTTELSENVYQDENALVNRTSKQPFSITCGRPTAFSIHVDSEGVSSSTTKEHSIPAMLQQLPTAVTTSSRQPLSEVFLNLDQSADSPMVLDASMQSEQDTSERIVDIEENDAETQSAAEYAADIYQYLKEAEQKHRPKPGYMRKQPDINSNMRCILVDWLVEVAGEYRLHDETLYLAVSYIDRFLSQMSVLRSKLQLVGAASMFVAAKFEEIYPPDVGEFVYITDDTYKVKQVLRMEHLILKVLSFDLALPTINSFLSRYLKATNADNKTEHLARYLAELTLQQYDPYIRYLPSLIAASAVCLANHTMEKPAWSALLTYHTGYKSEEISQCVKDLFQTFINAPNSPQQAVREKYKAQKFSSISLVPAPVTAPLL